MMAPFQDSSHLTVVEGTSIFFKLLYPIWSEYPRKQFLEYSTKSFWSRELFTLLKTIEKPKVFCMGSICQYLV